MSAWYLMHNIKNFSTHILIHAQYGLEWLSLLAILAALLLCVYVQIFIASYRQAWHQVLTNYVSTSTLKVS